MAEKVERVLKGIAASPGIAIGAATILGDTLSTLDIREKNIGPSLVASEIEKLEKALEETRNQILKLKKGMKASLKNEAAIFDAHLLIVDDQVLIKEVKDQINNGKSADFSFYSIIKRYISAIAGMPDPYIRERAVDIKDVASRVLSNLTGVQKRSLSNITGQRIIFAHDLTPSDTAEIDSENLQAFVVKAGSRTSHTAILARSMKIPAIVGVQEDLLTIVKDEDLVIVDGFTGSLIINPTAETQKIYAVKEEKNEKYYADLIKESTLRPETIDGFCIQLAANIEHQEDVKEAIKYGAAGVGLFRTEYMYLNQDKLPDEEKQYNVYREITANLNNQPMIVRTLDVGGDKLSKILSVPHEPNPFLGLRAIRLCLATPELIKTQMRAILRASAYGDIKIMFPMITCAEELDQLLELLETCKEELKAKKLPLNEDIETGIMIETPSAALIANTLAAKVDFFSIGTNDLVQYTMAVDRSNERVAYLYQPSHPAILSLIQQVVKAARDNRIWVSVCGEMASDPRYTPILVGMGVHELSMGPVSLGIIRRIIRRIKMHEAEKIAEYAINCRTAAEALEISETFLNDIAPDIIDITTGGL